MPLWLRNAMAAAALLAAGYISMALIVHTVKAQEDRHGQRLVTITYNLLEKRLYGDIAQGSTFIVDRLGEQFVMDPLAGTMSLDSETRGFDKETAEQEKENLQKVLNLLSRYMADSVVWWHQGNGEKVSGAPRRAQR